jgi:hypothetical protein
VTLDQLQEAIQVAFGWTGYYRHAFDVDRQMYGHPDPELDFQPEHAVRLSGWPRWGEADLHVRLRRRLAARDRGGEAAAEVGGVSYRRCTAARRAAPPEECGGILGYPELLGCGGARWQGRAES